MTVVDKPNVSIIIDNYNYGHFLADAIDSALDQTFPRTEVIVVDDGSTDDSVEVIKRFGERVVPIIKPNGGQASAFNAGFLRSEGEIIIFLDADDILLRDACAEAWGALADPRVSRAYWPMHVVDMLGRPTGELTNHDLPEGDLSERVLAGGPYMYRWSPTSGNAWRRTFLEAVLPVPEAAFTNYVDNYLSALSPLHGTHVALGPLACWRSHKSNETKESVRVSSFLERLEAWTKRFDACLAATRDHCSQLGLAFDEDRWRSNSWFHRLRRAVAVIDTRIPAGTRFILVDGDSWETGGTIDGRQALRPMERDGAYWGRPPDGAVAVAELERMRDAGARFLAISWTCWWWLEHYDGLKDWLERHAEALDATDDIRIYGLG